MYIFKEQTLLVYAKRKEIFMGIKKVKLNYRPVAVRRSNEIAYEVSNDHVNAVNRSIARKVQRNETEKNASRDVAARYVVRQK